MGAFARAIGLALLVILVPEPASADDGAGQRPASGIVYTNLLVGRLNPLGLKDDFNLMYRKLLVDSDHILLRDSYVSMGLMTSFKPTAAQLGFGMELQPVAVLRLMASVQWVGHFTPFDNLVSFDSPRSDHSDDDIEKLGELALNYPTQGVYLTLGVLLQAKLGPIAVRNDLRAVYADLDLRKGDTVFYEIEWDVLAPDGGWVLFNNTDVLYMSDFGFMAGVRYSLTHAAYGPDAFGEGESTKNPNTPVHKLGPVLGFSFKDVKPGFKKPTVLIMAGWYLEHRYRAGQAVNQGIPCLIAAFAFSGDLLG